MSLNAVTGSQDLSCRNTREYIEISGIKGYLINTLYVWRFGAKAI